MEALVLNRKFQTLAIIDAFESFIWAERYNTPGDFEIYMPIAIAPLDAIKRDNYIWIRGSDRLQIIEDLEIVTNSEDGDYITITGRTLESILERRSVYTLTYIEGTLQDGFEQLLNENALNPTDKKRKIPELRFIRNDDDRLNDLPMLGTFFGESLLDIAETYCEVYDLGFKIVFNEEDSMFEFSFYYGEDRSYNQDTNLWVVFSENYDNLIGSNYFESFKELRTAAVICSENSEDYGQEFIDIDEYPDLTGLDRREMGISNSSVRWEVEKPDEDAIEEEIRAQVPGNMGEYEIQQRIDKAIEEAWTKAIDEARIVLREELVQRAKEELASTYITKTFEGEIDATLQYVYGVDFFLGDVVQVRNKYGKEASSRITEIVRSHDASGEKLTPTFTTLIGSDNEGDISNPDI